MIETLTTDLINFLHLNPHWGAIITFVVAFTESLAVIGTIVPGSVTMTAVGILVGTGALPMASTLMWATLGALLGDFVSYWVGLRYGPEIRASRLFRKRQHWLEQGEAFFEKHGGKSVIIGRFFGPVRSLVPLIAGLLKMTIPRFTIAVIPAAFLWAVVYMSPGIALGAMSLELPPGIATRFALYGLLLVFAIWGVTRISKLFLDQIWYWCDQVVLSIWLRLRARKHLEWFLNLLADPRNPENHQQLMLVFIALLSAVFFLTIFWHVAHQGVLTAWNQPVFHLLDSLRTYWLDVIMMSFTFLADKKHLALFSLIVFVYFIARKRYRAAFHWAAVIVLGIGLAYGIKHFFYNPRPHLFIKGVSSSSFPSGHTTAAMVAFGFMAVLIGHELPTEQKRIPYRIAFIIVLLVCASRLYFGAHWLTDVLGSMMLGLTAIAVVTISYRRHLVQHIAPASLAIFAGGTLLFLNLIVGIFQFSSTLNNYEKPIILEELTAEQWWNEQDNGVRLYRLNRLGKPKEQLTLQWLGDIQQIQQHLTTLGWRAMNAPSSPRNLLKRAAEQQGPYRMTLIPQQYHGNVPALLMVKNTTEDVPMVLRLWESDVNITNNSQHLYVGNVQVMESHIKEKRQQTLKDRNLDILLGLNRYQVKSVRLSDSMQAKIPVQILVWDRILRIRQQ